MSARLRNGVLGYRADDRENNGDGATAKYTGTLANVEVRQLSLRILPYICEKVTLCLFLKIAPYAR
ncbi:hypothetical protein GCM10007868_18510 [Gluconobacter frateurii]|uniref:Uncharacterized protein n=1 Tax=Gluconobacter frateurii NRIC 0228 TaxID=1307946 RepID=A0ABQ0QFL2_9PROT|nr:hypothetical protein AA0228_2976 [Gluconobacter frateurii NRIC 0228]GLP90776.1 hypothetical protein GCM10007868_18510 [Gluconobacter frateurii]